jgi:hypothetical protein
MVILPKRLFAQFVLLLSMILIATIVSLVAHDEAGDAHTEAIVRTRRLWPSTLSLLPDQDLQSNAFLVLVAELPDVKRIEVYEPDGKVVAEAVRQGDCAVEVMKPRIEALPVSPDPSISEGGKELLVWHPVAPYNLIGWVRLSYGLEAVTELRSAIWTYTILLLSVWIPLGSCLSLVVRRPVSAITSFRVCAKIKCRANRSRQVSERAVCPAIIAEHGLTNCMTGNSSSLPNGRNSTERRAPRRSSVNRMAGERKTSLPTSH